MNKVVSASQAYGSFRAHISTIIITFIGVIGIICCLVMLLKTIKYKTISGRIENANCKQTHNNNDNSNQILYNCNLEVNYTIDNKRFNENIDKISSFKYKSNTPVKLSYNKNDKTDISLDIAMTRWVSGIIIIFLAFIMVMSHINLHMVKTNKDIAGVEGALGFISNVSTIAKR